MGRGGKSQLVCCRAHAPIAGYSTGIPTLVVGYSVKSQGIGEDLGMERWVLPLERSERLAERLTLLWKSRAEISAVLKMRQDNIIQQYDEQKIRADQLPETGK